MSTETLLTAEDELTFDVEDLTAPDVLIVGTIPDNTIRNQECKSNQSCYTATCTWAECCDC